MLSKYMSYHLKLGLLLSAFISISWIGRADLGETRDQIIARYGKPYSETRTTLYFSSKDGPGMVTLGSDGKSIQEVYGYDKDIGQQHVMEILIRNSKGRAWRATKLDYPDSQMVWRYTQLELKIHASYERNDEAHDSIYYGLTISH